MWHFYIYFKWQFVLIIFLYSITKTIKLYKKYRNKAKTNNIALVCHQQVHL